jgi:hypothetical protein
MTRGYRTPQGAADTMDKMNNRTLISLLLFGDLLDTAFAAWNFMFTDFKRGFLQVGIKYLLELWYSYQVLGSQNSVGIPGGVQNQTQHELYSRPKERSRKQ